MNAYIYISKRADYDPVKTLFVCAPGKMARSHESAEQFAIRSGWKELAEYEKAALIIPIVPNGWMAAERSLLFDIFQNVRNSFSSRNGRSLLGRKGKLWCWETLIYVTGYEDGAEFAGNCVVEYPNMFAAAALIRGVPQDYTRGEEPSNHWLVPKISDGYHKKNNQIPSCVWVLDIGEEEAGPAREYFKETAHCSAEKLVMLGPVEAMREYNPDNPAEQFLYSEDVDLPLTELPGIIVRELFNRVIRWKDGPDGTLSIHPDYTEYYEGKEFIQHTITADGLDYPFGVHLPKGMTKEEVKNLPVVFTVHGRGEPAWLFCTKNGWDRLADDTREFIVAVPDSPGNIWLYDRDKNVFEQMIEELKDSYLIDEARIYLTGFSNGGMITREAGTAAPELFAALVSYNAPGPEVEISRDELIAPELIQSGYEIPYFLYVGDSDPVTKEKDIKEQIRMMCEVNHCEHTPLEVRTGENYYTENTGYRQGERFHTELYKAEDGTIKVGCTVMKDMPHGAITEQSKAAWEWIKHFRRQNKEKKVQSDLLGI